MTDFSTKRQAIELLQQLGLKQYEAESFVALARRRRGTAKDISEASEVPRTRVYDAVRVLEAEGLVETQHSKPKEFRAVSIDEAVTLLRNKYVERTESLRTALGDLEPSEDGDTSEVTHEVWAVTGSDAIAGRTHQLVETAREEVVLVVGDESIFTDDLAEHLGAAVSREVEVIVGTASESLRHEVEEVLPDARVFVSGLSWLTQSPLPDDDTEIGRLLLVDREAILVSSYVGADEGDLPEVHGVFGRGFDNSVVAVARRLMATGLLTDDDPADEAH